MLSIVLGVMLSSLVMFCLNVLVGRKVRFVVCMFLMMGLVVIVMISVLCLFVVCSLVVVVLKYLLVSIFCLI